MSVLKHVNECIPKIELQARRTALGLVIDRNLPHSKYLKYSNPYMPTVQLPR